MTELSKPPLYKIGDAFILKYDREYIKQTSYSSNVEYMHCVKGDGFIILNIRNPIWYRPNYHMLHMAGSVVEVCDIDIDKDMDIVNAP